MSAPRDTVYTVDGSLSQLLQLGLSSEQFEPKLQSWHEHLAENQVTEEMRQVFVALGWLTARDRRVQR